MSIYKNLTTDLLHAGHVQKMTLYFSNWLALSAMLALFKKDGDHMTTILRCHCIGLVDCQFTGNALIPSDKVSV